MAPKPWHNDAQHMFFDTQMPEYIRRRGQGKLYKFWGPMFEEWFRLFPEQAVLGFPVPGTPDAPLLTKEQHTQLGDALVARKKVNRVF